MIRLHCVAPLLAGFGCSLPEDLDDPAPWVDLVNEIDPFIGTGGLGFSVGCSYPGAALPLSLVKASPDTADAQGLAYGAQRGGGYHYDDVYIQGFSHMHLQGVGLTDYGLISLMPIDGIPDGRTTPEGYQAAFSHQQEHASPGHYAVTLLEPDIDVEISVTPHTALHRIQYDDAVNEPVLLINPSKLMGTGQLLSASVSIDPDQGRVSGHVRQDGEMSAPFSVWFVMEVEPPPISWGTWSDTELTVEQLSIESMVANEEDDTVEAIQVGGWLQFDTREVHVRMALSTVDAEGALTNMEQEHTGFELQDTQDAALAIWEQALAGVRVAGGTESQRSMFASSLYRALLMPNLYSDVDGRYRGFDQNVHDDPGHRYFTDFSLWDTYRTTHPLYTFLWPDEHREMLRSWARMAEQGGNLPRWPLALWDGGFMVGSPAHIVVAEAVQKGLNDFEEDALLDIALLDAFGSHEPEYGARPDIELYEQVGFYPADQIRSSVSWTLEAALADYALAQVAPSQKTQAYLAERSTWWKNLYDPDVGFIHGRNTDGSFQELVSEGTWLSEFSEGNARQYLWAVPHDPEGLFSLLGGEAIAMERLNDFFEQAVTDETLDWLPQGWFWAGNEHDIHTPYLFALGGRPELTHKWVDWVVDTHYSDQADGLPGNDDGATLSAWLAWTAMGMYPLAGTDRYVLSRPWFERIEIDRPDGTLRIERCPEGDVGEIWLDGTALTSTELRHEELACASLLEFRCAYP